MVFSFGRRKTKEELQEDDERLDIELSVAQKRAALKKAKEYGVSRSNFGSWREFWHWFKTH